jgi:hypothetical protein
VTSTLAIVQYVSWRRAGIKEDRRTPYWMADPPRRTTAAAY